MEMTEQMYIETLKTIQAMGGAKSDLPNFLNEGLKVIMEFIQCENERQKKVHTSIPTYETPTKVNTKSFDEKLKETNSIFDEVGKIIDDKAKLEELKIAYVLNLIERQINKIDD